MNYIAFLRGINVGGNSMVKMTELKKVFEGLGYEDVITLLNSGNVCFQTDQRSNSSLEKNIELTLEKVFGWPISVIVRSQTEVEELIAINPFQTLHVTSDTRLYVTFLKEFLEAQPSKLASGPGFRIIKIVGQAICSIVTHSTSQTTTDLMKVLEEKYGRGVTTRNWNTVLKVAAAWQAGN